MAPNYMRIALAVIVVVFILYIATVATNMKEETKYRLLVVQAVTLAQFLFFFFAKYTWSHLYTTSTSLSTLGTTRSSLTRKLFFLPLAFVLTMAQFSIISGYVLSNVEPHWFVVLTFSCFGIMLIMVTLVFISQILDSLLALLNFHRGRRPSSPAVFKSFCILVLTVVFAISAFFNAAQPPAVKSFRIPVVNLPDCFKGMTFLQLSDLHIGPTVGKTQVEFIVELSNKLKPDVVLFSGDLVDAPLQIKPAVKPLEKLNAKYGTFFVAGRLQAPR